jgi:hypothetical protein
MTLIGDRVALLKAQIVDAFHQIHLLVGIAVGELVIVGVIECFRQSVGCVVLVRHMLELRGTAREADDEPVVPGLCLRLDQRNVVGDSRQRIKDGAGNVIAGTGYIWRSGIGAANKMTDELPRGEDVQSIRRD